MTAIAIATSYITNFIKIQCIVKGFQPIWLVTRQCLVGTLLSHFRCPTLLAVPSRADPSDLCDDPLEGALSLSLGNHWTMELYIK